MKHQIKNQIKKASDLLLRPLGLELRRAQNPQVQYSQAVDTEAFYRQRYEVAVHELHGCYTSHIFPNIPFDENREPLLKELMGTNVSEAFWLLHKLRDCLALDGDICEFGVANGATSALIAHEIKPTAKSFWLFDSFQGLSKPTEKDQLIDDIFNWGTMAAYEGAMSYPAEVVKSRLAALPFPEARTHIVPGFIEESIKSAALPDQVCFAYIDFDLYQPILDGLGFLTDHLVVNGCVMVDDYGYFSSGAQTAVDEFVAAQQGRFSIELPPAWAGHFAVLTRRQ